MRTPAAEVQPTTQEVTDLLRAQHPDLAHHRVTLLGSGFDNTLYRLGPDLMVRIPRRPLGAVLIEREIAWLPVLAPDLPLAVPSPVRVGAAADAVPWRWTVVPWIPGSTVDAGGLDATDVPMWAAFLRTLHRPAPFDAPTNTARGIPLRIRQPMIEERMCGLTSPISPSVWSAWQAGLAAPIATERRWLHGDLHPRNILAVQGRLAGVIDWGDLCGGDPATDLASVWMLFASAPDRTAVFDLYGADEALMARARGWAVALGTLLATVDDDPVHRSAGLRTFARVAEDDP